MEPIEGRADLSSNIGPSELLEFYESRDPLITDAWMPG